MPGRPGSREGGDQSSFDHRIAIGGLDLSRKWHRLWILMQPPYRMCRCGESQFWFEDKVRDSQYYQIV